MDLKAIHENVKLLLLKHPELRNPFLRKQAHLEYWKEYDNLGKMSYIALKDVYPNLTSAETISRAI